MTAIRIQFVPTTELKLGDVVHFHGGRFRLDQQTLDAEKAATNAAMNVRPLEGADLEGALSLRAFRAELVGNIRDEFPCDMPTGWTIQGNHRARWAVEVPAVAK